VGSHGDVSIYVDPKVPDRRGRQHRCVTDADRANWDLKLATSRGTSEHLGLGKVELQPICHHPC